MAKHTKKMITIIISTHFLDIVNKNVKIELLMIEKSTLL